MTTNQNSNLKSRNRAVLLVLLALIALIFAITMVRIGGHGPAAVATPETPFGHSSGEADQNNDQNTDRTHAAQ